MFPLPDAPLLAGFVAASLVLALTPGPGVLYIVARSVAQGRRAGIASLAGVACGNLANALAAALGLAALMAVLPAAFTIVQWAGAAYLMWLGVQALRRPAASTGQPSDAPPQALRTVLRDGLVVALLNPKTTLFFAAFLPQFVSPGGSPALQSALLGALFVAIAATTDLGYVFASALLAPRLARLRGAGAAARYLSAGTYFGLGIFAVLSGSRPAR
jgi:threonine/homoserine/homoserine lactone efflux protein